jgi:hypothetical protein
MPIEYDDEGNPKFSGYCEKRLLPFKPGDRVLIPKGIPIRNVRRGRYVCGRAYTVTVHHILPGAGISEPFENPKIVWAGSAGYWSEADINDLPDFSLLRLIATGPAADTWEHVEWTPAVEMPQELIEFGQKALADALRRKAKVSAEPTEE